MTLRNLLGQVHILSSNADLDMEVGNLRIDSRCVEKGDLFFAVKGTGIDGHRFIPQAMAAGACCVICEDCPAEGSYVQVEDVRRAYSLSCCEVFGNPAKSLRMIGVTGTSGKTTTTNLIKHILETQIGAKCGLIGTNCNVIGHRVIHTEYTTPDSYELQSLLREMVDEGCSFCIMEVSSHSIAQHRVEGIHYEVAAFTNLSQDHLDLHGTMQEYAAVKRKLFSFCDTGCINMDDAWSDFMCDGAECPIIRTSANKKTDMYATGIDCNFSGVHFDIWEGESTEKVSLAIPGMFSVYNALTAISVCRAIGLSLSECSAGLASCGIVKGRMESVPTDGDYSVIIDYSHKPDPLEKVLKTLRPVTRGRLIVLFGCGGDRDRLKRPIMGRIAAQNSDYVLVTSDNPRTEDPEEIINEIMPGILECGTKYERISDRIEAIHRAIDIAESGDVILLAGKGHEDYQVVGHEKHHMDEREIVADYLKERNG